MRRLVTAGGGPVSTMTPSRELRAACLARHMIDHFDSGPEMAIHCAAAAWGADLATVRRLVALGDGRGAHRASTSFTPAWRRLADGR
jgi:hypothetical protein